jgi:hypothetical protein
MEDPPSWISLLQDVHHIQYLGVRRYHVNLDVLRTSSCSRWPALIAITRKTRSWDFMPPDIVRPVASTTLGCLITMAHRMGMVWSEFNLN